MTHSAETTGQHVEDETSEQIRRRQPEDFLLAAVRVVTPAQADDTVAKAEQAIVGQCDAVGVAGEILQHLSGSGKRLLRINDPVLSPQLLEWDLGNKLRIAVQRTTQSIEVLAAEDPRESTDRKQIASWSANPASTRGIESTGGDNAMQVDVQGEILTPAVQHGEDAGLGAKVAWIASEFAQRLGSGPKEQSVGYSRSQQRDGVQRVRQGEDHMHVIDGEQFLDTGF